MSSKKWQPNELELAFWNQATQGIKKQRLNKRIDFEPNLEKPEIKFRPRSDDYQYQKNEKELILNDDSNIDNSTITKMKKGDYKIDASIDLHGYTLKEAIQKFEEFILQSWHLKKRLLLVITGKGIGDNSIRSMLTNWVNNKNIRPFILRIGFASTKHGGTGAFYVLLKRDRNQKNIL